MHTQKYTVHKKGGLRIAAEASFFVRITNLAPPLVELAPAKTPHLRQGGLKEEGSVLWYATDD
ncbi:MAG: hypothetical protein BHV61_05965 [Collinsella sp. 60_9]|nr:MAG: hypothetical protein BHV61_05965 [Collinsella sp. 60_9]